MRNWNHIGRIIEAEIGGLREGEAGCDACEQKVVECWVYSKPGLVSEAHNSYARCRVEPRVCSLNNSKMREKKVMQPPVRPAYAPLLPEQ
jgi:hypothetical protein